MNQFQPSFHTWLCIHRQASIFLVLDRCAGYIAWMKIITDTSELAAACRAFAKHNYVTVVFGKSGIGKTSLLNAGLFPQLKDEGFWPILLPLDYGEPGLLKQAKKIIESEFKNNEILKKDGTWKVKEFGSGETLWEYFHRIKNIDNKKEKGVTPVLVLDQFEEMFTTHRERWGEAEGVESVGGNPP